MSVELSRHGTFLLVFRFRNMSLIIYLQAFTKIVAVFTVLFALLAFSKHFTHIELATAF